MWKKRGKELWQLAGCMQTFGHGYGFLGTDGGASAKPNQLSRSLGSWGYLPSAPAKLQKPQAPLL
jgi:hypothetical protein